MARHHTMHRRAAGRGCSGQLDTRGSWSAAHTTMGGAVILPPIVEWWHLNVAVCALPLAGRRRIFNREFRRCMGLHR